jgi:hypothetical protein
MRAKCGLDLLDLLLYLVEGVERCSGWRDGGLWAGTGGGPPLTEHVHVLPNLRDEYCYIPYCTHLSSLFFGRANQTTTTAKQNAGT